MKITIEVTFDADYSDDDAPVLKALTFPGSSQNILPLLSAYEARQAGQALISGVEDKILRKAERIQMRGDSMREIAREEQVRELASRQAQRGSR